MSLSRRAILAAATLLAAPHVARAQPRRLRLGHNNTATSVVHASAEGFAQALAAASNGRLTTEIVPNSALGNEAQMLKAVAEGTLDMTIAPVGTTAALAKEVGLTEALYLFRDAGHAREVLDGPLGRHCATLLSGKGFEVLSWTEIGVRHVTANKPVRRPADLQGLKIRVPLSEAIMESFRALGAAADALAFPQLSEALRTGRFDAQENPVSIIAANRLTQFQSHISLTAHVYTSGPLLISSEVLDELPVADRALVRQAGLAGAVTGRQRGDQLETEGLAAIRTAGTTIVTDVDFPAMRAAAGATRDRVVQVFGADSVRRIAGFAA